MPFQMLNCFLVGSQYWNIAYGREPGEAARDAEGMQTMRTLARNLAWLLKSAAAALAPLSLHLRADIGATLAALRAP